MHNFKNIYALLIILLMALSSNSQTASDSLSINMKSQLSFMNEITACQINRLPVRGFNDYIRLHPSPSVVIQDGKVHVRGVRADENAFYVNGFNVTNVLNNTNSIYLIPEAIKRIGIFTSDYGVQYGNANSGLFLTDIKTGTPEYEFYVNLQTDKFAAEGEKFLDTYSNREHILTAVAQGPLWDKKHRFFIAAENHDTGDYRKRFSYGFQFDGLVDMNYFNPDVQSGHPDTVDLVYPDGFTPFNSSNVWAINSTFTLDFHPLQIELTALYDWQKRYANDQPMLTILNKRNQYTVTNRLLLGGRLNYEFDQNNMAELGLSFYSINTELNDDYFGNEWQAWNDSVRVAQHTNGEVTYRDAWRSQRDYLLHGIYFQRNGTRLWNNDYFKSKQEYLGLSARFVNTSFQNHQISAGIELRSHKIRQYEIDPFIIIYLDFYDWFIGGPLYESLDDIPYTVARHYMGNTYGYDINGNELDEIGLDGPRKPLFGALYLQDRLSYKDLTLEAGLRVDYLDTDDHYLKNPQNPGINEETGLILDDSWADKDPAIEFSPRLKALFTVNDNFAIFTNYGKYVQVSQLSNIYYDRYQLSRQIIFNYSWTKNIIGFNLDPVKNSTFEMGLIKSFRDILNVNLSIFYKINNDLVRIKRMQTTEGGYALPYLYMANGDKSENKGLEIAVDTKRFKRFRAHLRYAYTDAKGSGSDEYSNHTVVERKEEYPTSLSPLDYARTHRGMIDLDFRFEKNDGGPIFERSGLNLLFTFSSGHPFTRAENTGGGCSPYDCGVDYMYDTRSRKIIEPVNSSTTLH